MRERSLKSMMASPGAYGHDLCCCCHCRLRFVLNFVRGLVCL